MTSFPVTERNRIRQHPERARYDAATIYAILDAARFGFMAWVAATGPEVQPVLFARVGQDLVVHGSRSSRRMQHLAAGGVVRFAVALLDGLVVTKSAFATSVNYRSVVVLGTGRALEDPAEKRAALRALSEKILPGHWAYARQPTERELAATAVAAVHMDLASAKVRVGPPKELPQDQDAPLWSGVLPVTLAFGEPQPAGAAAGPLPPHIAAFLQTQPRGCAPQVARGPQGGMP